ncbi:MAG TPA: hypothetical protein VK448_06635 [Dissulfurispiraceae bacterium]|nr:hypothetical protein [Dissulfurispiraceae bacterium]
MIAAETAIRSRRSREIIVSGETVFKKCPGCFRDWSTRDDFLSDNSLELNGYKADFEKLEYGLFFFTHKVDGCCSTMALEVKDFLGIYTGKMYTDRKTLSDECPGYCTDEKQLSRCDALCECAFAREIMHIIRQRQGSI